MTHPISGRSVAPVFSVTAFSATVFGATLARSAFVCLTVVFTTFTAAAKTPGTQRIEAVVLKQGYAMGYGGAIALEYSTTVLFRDGAMRQAQGAGTHAGIVVTAASKAATARYLLDGYSITMTYPDGQTQTRLFYLFPDSDNAIGLGDSTLSKRR